MVKLTRLKVLAGTASALVAAPQIVRAQATEKIRVCASPIDDLTPFLWALKNGLYQKAGLDVEYIPTLTGAATTSAVISGACELGKGSLIAILLAHLKNVPVTIVGNSGLWETGHQWALALVAADSTIKTGADLNGKVLCAPELNDLIALAFSAWVDKNGGDASTLKWVEIPNSAAGAAVASHRVAACELTEPHLKAALASGTVKVLAPILSAIAPFFALTVFFARPDWAKKNAGIVKKFVRTTYEAAAYTNTHPAETAPLISEIAKIPLPIVQTMTRASGATSSNPTLIQPVIDAAAKYGAIPRSFLAKELYFRA